MKVRKVKKAAVKKAGEKAKGLPIFSSTPAAPAA